MWSHPPPSLSLNSGEVHVWRARLEQPSELQEEFFGLLDRDEQLRASRFHFERHRRRFVLARGFLRTLIARYLQITPEDVRFTYGAYDKPALASEHLDSPLRFNASHSHELALFAFNADFDVGIDVEYIKANFATEEIATRFFSASEVETLKALPAEEKADAFFRCWTRKEAYIKAIGSGLSHPLDTFDVSLAPGEAAALLRVAQDAEAAARWSLFNLDVGEGYAAALAVEGHVHELHKFDMLCRGNE